MFQTNTKKIDNRKVADFFCYFRPEKPQFYRKKFLVVSLGITRFLRDSKSILFYASGVASASLIVTFLL